MQITLKTLPEATKQQVFDQVAKHLLTQKKVSYQDGGCAYRQHSDFVGEKTIMCAAGCLIADDEYDKQKMEGFNWRDLVNDNLVPKAHHDLIRVLQAIHDSAQCYWSESQTRLYWETRLKSTARLFNLEYNACLYEA